MIKRLIILLVLLTFTSSAAFADKMDDYVKREMAKEQVPGLSLVVVKDGKIIKSAGYGYANLEVKAPATPETIYQIQSVTKQFTATAVMMLAEEGKIVLDDKVSLYLTGAPQAWRNITVRNLLTHTSGIKDYINEPTTSLRLDVSDEDVFNATIKRELNFQPGEKYAYSNTNYFLLSIIIHKLTGKTYGEYLNERIFKPLGMSNTRIYSQTDIIPNRASGYLLDNGKLQNGGYYAASILGYAGGGIITNVLDMAKWDAGLYDEKLLKRSSFEQMWTSGKLNNGKSTGYGFGWAIGDLKGHRLVTHNGAHTSGFASAITRYLDDKLTIVVLTNQFGGSNPSFIADNVAGFFDPAFATKN